MTPATPLDLHRETVRPEWIDYNGHMNVAYYLLAFDHATDAVLDRFGIGKAYVAAENRSVFVVDAHLTYAREVTQGAPLRFDSLVLGAEGWLAATAEFMLLHVDLATRKTSPFPPAVAADLAEQAAAHAAGPWPPQAGRAVRQLNPDQSDTGRA